MMWMSFIIKINRQDEKKVNQITKGAKMKLYKTLPTTTS